MIPWAWRLILLLILIFPVLSQLDSKGFLSIDCGLPANSTYVDETTNLTFISDVQFINSGIVGRINSNSDSMKLSKELQTVRYFPTRLANCYNLTALTVGFKYLIRALFYYGNYDNLNMPPSFYIFLGLDLWDTVNASSSKLLRPEMIFMASADNLQVCLVNNGNGVPFISSIHLRQLTSSIYPLVNSTYSLQMKLRYNIGASNRQLVRYPDDTYDRWWSNYTKESWTEISTNSTVAPDAGFQIPSLVMQTAATTSSTKVPLTINWTATSYPSFSYYYLIVLHFTEIRNTSMADRTEFTVTLNTDQKLNEHIPGWLTPDFKSFLVDVTLNTYVCSLEATSNSTLPPLFNAFEMYELQYRYLPTDRQDVDAINSIKEHYKIESWLNLTNDPCFVHSWENISCHYSTFPALMNETTTVTKLNLSSLGLKGVLIDSFGNLTSLVSLDLSMNNLSGYLPDSLDKLTSLQFLDIRGNSMLDTTLPPKLHQKYVQKSIWYRFDESHSTSAPNVHPKNVITITIAVVVPLLIIVVFIATVLLLKRKYDGDDAEQNWEVRAKQNFPKFECRKFSYNDLKGITNNFENKIGTGGFGSVFLGILEDGVEVAVKMHSQLSAQGVKEVLAEAESLTRVHHKYLVALLGYCIDKKCMALVYEYMEEGNLYDKLKDNKNPISWRQRLRIAYESASGLEYLHKACNPPVIHRDVKTSNILLTASLQAKIADFGLSRAFNNTISHVSTRVVGTPGYLDPEYYLSSGQLTIKSDVYSFGVVLLEIITGQPPLMVDVEGSNLVQWVHQKLSGGDIESIVDSRMLGEYDINSVRKLVNLACKCTELKTSERPTMTEVAAELKESLDMEISIEEMDCRSTDNLITDVSQDSTFEMAYLSGMSLPSSGEREFAAHSVYV